MAEFKPKPEPNEPRPPKPGGSRPPKIGALAPWFGSKRLLADHVVEQLGAHRAYFELFAGSCSVLLAKPESQQKTAVDLHGDLTNLAFVVASPRYADLLERAERVLYSEDLFRHCRSAIKKSEPPASLADVSDEHVDRAVLYFCVSWIGRNGCAGTAKGNDQFAVRWTPNGGSGPTRFRSAVESISAWHERLRNVAILRRDAFEVVASIGDQEGVAIYADPPYLRDTRSSSSGSARYLHDFNEPQHFRLAQELRRFVHARVVVSYYASPRLAELYPGWTQIDCSHAKSLSVAGAKGSVATTAPEVLVVNGPRFGDQEAER